MKWQRYCPECGFAASRLDRTCPRCGCDLTEGAESPGDSSGADTDNSAKSRTTGSPSSAKPNEHSSGIRRWLPAVLAATVVILLAEAAGLYLVCTSGPAGSASAVDGVEPAEVGDGFRRARALTQHGESPSVSLPDASGIGELFTARPSPRARPTIEMYNRTGTAPIYVEFSGPGSYSGIIRPGAKLKFQLPRGRYSVRLSAAGIEPRSGQAVFKRHTHYTSEWHIVSGVPGYNPPLRMGDLSD